MTKKPRTASKPVRRRSMRARSTPKWIEETSDLDQMAKRRCLMVLSVLSGEKPVTEAIAEAEITRPLYYHLEKRALIAMLRALTPGTETNADQSAGMTSQIRQLEDRVRQLEREKRRLEHMLFLTRKVVGPGPFKMKAGRPPKSKPPSTTSGRKLSSSSRKTSSPASTSSTPNSTPTTDGEGAS